MYCDEEEITVVQKLNRTLRSVNKIVRARLQKVLEEKDELFLMLCATEDRAGEALWKVWEQGKLTCDPDDYESIVNSCLQALSQKPNAPLPNSGP
jgi:hypothetical protein